MRERIARFRSVSYVTTKSAQDSRNTRFCCQVIILALYYLGRDDRAVMSMVAWGSPKPLERVRILPALQIRETSTFFLKKTAYKKKRDGRKFPKSFVIFD